MTKSTATAAQTVHLTTADRPYVIKLIGYSLPTFAEAVVHVRQGYLFSADEPVEFYGPTGMVAITLHLGDPDSFVIDRAKASLEQAMEAKRAEYDKAVKEEARQLVAQQQAEELKRKAAAEVAEHQARIEAIQKEAAKAAAAL